MISFIIPAHNEEALIGRTLAALHDAARRAGEEYEIVVANDASTDRTGEIARAHGARLVTVNHRQIAAARNAGARAAAGEIFIFVDADTTISTRALGAAMRVLRSGRAVGGGCAVHIDGRLPFYAVCLERILQSMMPAIGLPGGCFLFCTRRAYFAAGGFDESLFCTEEVAFAQRLKRMGRFIVLRERVITSGRKLRAHSALDLLRLGLRLAWAGPQALRRREGLEFWYGPRQGST